MKKPFNKRILSARPKISIQRTSGLRTFAVAAVFAGVTICQAARIDRIDVYDKSDNHLLFVTFDYDSTGKNTGRSVFASDSTFLRSTKFQPSGAAVKESSVDFDGNLVFATTISPASGGKTVFSTVDQFGLDQLGGSMSYAAPSPNNYDVSQNNVTLCKEQYQFGVDGTLARINVLDKNGLLIYYALSNAATGVTVRPHALNTPSLVVTVKRGCIRVLFDLVHSGHVCVELYTPAGRRAAVLIDKDFKVGTHAFSVHALGFNGNQLGNGAYICRLTIENATAISKKIILQR